MSLVNLTPHPIRVYGADAPDTVHDLADGLLFQIQPADKPARIAMIDLGQDRHVYDEVSGLSAWVEWVQFGQCHDLPQPEPGTTLVVSLVVALAVPARSDVVFPMSEVRNPAGTVVGCRGFGRVG